MKNLIIMSINDSVTHVFCPGMFLFLAEEHKVGTSACFGLKIDPESSECCPHRFVLFPHFHSRACAACCCGRAKDVLSQTPTVLSVLLEPLWIFCVQPVLRVLQRFNKPKEQLIFIIDCEKKHFIIRPANHGQ